VRPDVQLSRLHFTTTKSKEEEEVYICVSRLGLIKMNHGHSGKEKNGSIPRLISMLMKVTVKHQPHVRHID
jgi:hypothetical protein